MDYKDYDEMNAVAIDVFREIGNIGTGHAATALSSTLGSKIMMSLPEVNVLGYDQAIESLGGAEKVIAAVLVHMSGEVSGTMLYMMDLSLIQLILEKFGMPVIHSYREIDEMSTSAATEIANIIIASYTNAISQLGNVSINLSVPSIAVNMLGGIMSVPMIEYGYVTDKIMMVGGQFIYNEESLSSTLIMLPEIQSLNFLLDKLGVKNYE